MALEQKDRPDYRCAAYNQMAPEQKLVRDVTRGALHLRALREEYLPQFPAEHDKKYEIRRKTATLFNATERTVMGLKGLAMKKPPVLSDDVPEVVRGRKEVRDEESGEVKTQKAEGHWENIDLAGTHGDVFASEVLEDALTDGHAFVLVDMQKALGEGATLEDEIRSGRRPYWVKYRKDQAVNWRAAKINGQLVIGQITFEEVTLEPDGAYGERAVMRYRIFALEEYADVSTREIRHRVRFEVKRKVRDEKTNEESFVVEEEGYVTGFDRIPVAVVYGRRTGFLQSQPPLLDLAVLNVSYFQKKSDRDNVLHLCCSPTPVFSGVPEDWNMLVTGSGFGIKLPLGAAAAYLEPEGVALEESREDLKELRGEMAALGLTMLEGRPEVAVTATETTLDFSEQSSELETVCRSEQDAFELCLGFHARYLGQKSGGSCAIGAHLKSLRLTQQMIQTLSGMAAADQLSLLTLWDMMVRADALPETFNAKTEEERLEKQMDKQAERQRKTLGASLLDFDKGGAPGRTEEDEG